MTNELALDLAHDGAVLFWSWPYTFCSVLCRYDFRNDWPCLSSSRPLLVSACGVCVSVRAARYGSCVLWFWVDSRHGRA